MKQRHGFALIAAIFLLVVLGALAFYLVSLSTTQRFTSLLAVQGARAHFAAQAGLNWGAHRALTSKACGNLMVDAGNGPSFAVVVTCTSSTSTELDETVTLWRITATATLGTPARPDYVYRQMTMTVK